MNITKTQRDQMNQLSVATFGTSSRWQKIVDNSLFDTQLAEYLVEENGLKRPPTVEEVQAGMWAVQEVRQGHMRINRSWLRRTIRDIGFLTGLGKDIKDQIMRTRSGMTVEESKAFHAAMRKTKQEEKQGLLKRIFG
jgi:hypothetical protein